MRETLKNAWKVVEIRKKILYTVGEEKVDFFSNTVGFRVSPGAA